MWVWTPAGPQPGASTGRYGYQIPDHDRPAPTPAAPVAAPPARRHPPTPRSPCCPSTTCRATPPPTPSPTGWSRKSRRRCRASATSPSSRAIRPMPPIATRPAICARCRASSACATCMEGSLRKAGDRVRVTAQLIDAESGAHLWADSYDGVVDNIFDFEDQIAERVAGALHPSIRAAEIEQARRKRPDSVAAYDLVLRAMPHLWTHRAEANAEAIRLLDEAHRIDPGLRARFRLRRLGPGAAGRLQLGRRYRGDAGGGRPADRACRRHGQRRSDGALRPVDGDHAALRRSRPRPELRRSRLAARSRTSPGAGRAAASSTSIAASRRRALPASSAPSA